VTDQRRAAALELDAALGSADAIRSACERARNYGDAPDLDRIAANAERIAEKVAGAKSLLAEEPA
jgi:hypothetical protein